jgi:hypothetical protein
MVPTSCSYQKVMYHKTYSVTEATYALHGLITASL